MHQDALHELMENFRRQLLNIQVTIHDLQELIHSLNVFLLILQFRRAAERDVTRYSRGAPLSFLLRNMFYDFAVQQSRQASCSSAVTTIGKYANSCGVI